jgi:hypothetical protein
LLKGIFKAVWFFILLSVVKTSTAQHFVSSTDTIKLDLNQSFFDGSDVEIPISIQSSSTIYSIDLALRFNTARIVFDSLTNVLNGLQYLYFLNPIDSIWRITSYHPNGIQPGSIAFNLRFATTSNEVCAYDFTDAEAFVNGDSSACQITGCMNNLSIQSIDAVDITKVFPNPFINQLFISSDSPVLVQVYDTRGKLVFEAVNPKTIDTGSWHTGMYYLNVFGYSSKQAYKLLKLLP